MSWFKIRLSRADLRLIEQVGSGRQNTKDAVRARDRRVDRFHSSTQVHKAGFAAEVAVARFLSLEPDAVLTPRGNAGVSLVCPGQDVFPHRISVEYNSLTWGDLRFFPDRIPPADIFVLVSGRLPTLAIVGWCNRQVLTDAVPTELPGQGLRLLIPQSKLRPPEELLFQLGIPKEKWPAQADRADFAWQDRRDLA